MALIAVPRRILMQESFWWRQCSYRYIISLFPHLHALLPPSLLSDPNKPYGSVDVKYHAVYFLSDVY